MEKLISNDLIRSFAPCYDPDSVGILEKEGLPVKLWVEKYENRLESKGDIFWLLLREEFMSSKDLRLFAVWCAREALKLVDSPDERSVKACEVAESYTLGESTKKELDEAWSAAWSAAKSAAWSAAKSAAWSAAKSAAAAAAADAAAAAAKSAAWSAAWSAARRDQLKQLLTYF